MTVETFLELISTKTWSLNSQSSTLKIAQAAWSVCVVKNRTFRHPKVFLRLYIVIM